jgi:hypothetical protein
MLRICKVRKDCFAEIGHDPMVLTKRLHFLIFQLAKGEQGPLRICQLLRG